MNKGFSLIELMLVLFISGIVTLGTASLIQSQQNELQKIEDRESINQFKLDAIQVVKSPSNCTWQLAGATNTTSLDLSAVTKTTSAKLNAPIQTLYTGTTVNSPIFFKANTDVASLANKYTALSLTLENILPGINANNYLADLVFQVQSKAANQEIKKINVPISFNVNSTDPVSAKKVSSCCSGSDCTANTAGGGGSTVSIFCYSGSNSVHTCTKNIASALNFAALGVSPSSIKLISCSIDQTNSYDVLSARWGGRYWNQLTYNQSTSDVSLSAIQAGVTVKINISTDPNAVSGLGSSFTCL